PSWDNAAAPGSLLVASVLPGASARTDPDGPRTQSAEAARTRRPHRLGDGHERVTFPPSRRERLRSEADSALRGRLHGLRVLAEHAGQAVVVRDRPGLATLGQDLLGDMEFDRPGRDVDGDRVPVLDERDR